jgi:hypothetical protein
MYIFKESKTKYRRISALYDPRINVIADLKGRKKSYLYSRGRRTLHAPAAPRDFAQPKVFLMILPLILPFILYPHLSTFSLHFLSRS